MSQEPLSSKHEEVPTDVPIVLKKVKQHRKEERLYEPIKNALKRDFEQLGECYLENTSKGIFSEELKRTLDRSALHMLRVEKFSPDLTGFLKRKGSVSKEIIVVEIKPDKIKIKNVAQTRLYADVLNAHRALIISPKGIEVERKLFLKERPGIIRSYAYEPILIVKFDEETNEFTLDRELYSSAPEPFKYLAGYCEQCGEWYDFLVRSDYRLVCKNCQTKSSEKAQ